MSELALPKLKRALPRDSYIRDEVFSSVFSRDGYWVTQDERFVITRTPLGNWMLYGIGIEGTRVLWRAGLSDFHGKSVEAFPTRREALEALALALHLKGRQ